MVAQRGEWATQISGYSNSSKFLQVRLTPPKSLHVFLASYGMELFDLQRESAAIRPSVSLFIPQAPWVQEFQITGVICLPELWPFKKQIFKLFTFTLILSKGEKQMLYKWVTIFYGYKMCRVLSSLNLSFCNAPCLLNVDYTYEPRHEKTSFLHMGDPEAEVLTTRPQRPLLHGYGDPSSI